MVSCRHTHVKYSSRTVWSNSQSLRLTRSCRRTILVLIDGRQGALKRPQDGWGDAGQVGEPFDEGFTQQARPDHQQRDGIDSMPAAAVFLQVAMIGGQHDQILPSAPLADEPSQDAVKSDKQAYRLAKRGPVPGIVAQPVIEPCQIVGQGQLRQPGAGFGCSVDQAGWKIRLTGPALAGEVGR